MNVFMINAEIDSSGNAILSGQSTFNKNIEFNSSTNRLNRINVTITDNATKVSALNSVRNEKSVLVALDKGGPSVEMYKLDCVRK